MKLLRLKIIRRWQAFIRSQYIKMRRGTNFVKEAYLIPVKKGNIKYYLYIIETYDGSRLRFNIGRHFIRDCDVQELSIS